MNISLGAMGGALLLGGAHYVMKANYSNFSEEAAQEFHMVYVMDELDEAYDDFKASSHELESYSCGKNCWHSPNPKKSDKKLHLAMRHLDNAGLELIEVEQMHQDAEDISGILVDWPKPGFWDNSEKHYEPIRLEIEELRDQSDEVSNFYETQVPQNMADERNSKISTYKGLGTTALWVGVAGLFGAYIALETDS